MCARSGWDGGAVPDTLEALDAEPWMFVTSGGLLHCCVFRGLEVPAPEADSADLRPFPKVQKGLYMTIQLVN